MKNMTPISYVGGPRDGEADVFEFGDIPNDIATKNPAGKYKVRRLVDTHRFVFLWVPE